MKMNSWIPRIPEPELMDDPKEVKAYDESDFSEVNRQLAQRLIALSGPVGKAIDLGTGPASIPLELCQLAPGWEVLAMDAGPQMLKKANENIRKAKLTKNIKTLNAKVQSLPKGIGKFDLVFSNSLLHHLADPISLWQAAKSLLRSDGMLVVQDLFRPDSSREIQSLVKRHCKNDSKLLRELFEQSLYSAFTVEEIRQQIDFVGGLKLRVQKISDRHVLIMGRLD